MRSALSGALSLLAAAPLLAQAAAPAAGRFDAEIAAFEAADRAEPPPKRAVLFIGSSSIRMWDSLSRDFPRLRVINRGFGGSEMSDVLQYAGRIVIPYAPRVIVLYEGDNDLANGKSPERVIADVRAFLTLVRERLPGTRVVLLSVKPSIARWNIVDSIRRTNTLLRAESARDSLVRYVDIYTPMLGAGGRPRPELFLSDGLHMTPAGYAIWRAAVAPAVAPAKLRRPRATVTP